MWVQRSITSAKTGFASLVVHKQEPVPHHGGHFSRFGRRLRTGKNYFSAQECDGVDYPSCREA
jgi:hypothetical protein